MKTTAEMQITFANKQWQTPRPDVINDVRYDDQA